MHALRKKLVKAAPIRRVAPVMKGTGELFASEHRPKRSGLPPRCPSGSIPHILVTMRRTIFPATLFGLGLCATASAQNVNWATFQEDASRLSASAGLGSADPEEKDYAWADLDKDGWIDLVAVRKQPFTTSGRKVNVLFMNENGVLVDRTSQYAAASDVPGDQGFLTPTNDRDVVIVDVDLDGWLDVVTATTITPGQPKHLSHPRIYMNLGEIGGVWQGLLYQEARTPDWGTFPNMCGIDAGDVTGDGYPDLYFAHYQQSADVDLNDRLLINDGNGFFTDESTSRMTASMRGSSFGTTCSIEDFNGDGVNDILSVSGLGSTTGASRVAISYNNPNNEGFFNVLHEPYTGAPYHATAGDLNQDGMLDMIISDDGSDRYMLNMGNDAFGRVQWSPDFTFGASDLGFASNNLVRDLDGDGWAEAIIADVDVDIGGCGRRLQIYHNRGGVVGGMVTLREETGGGSWGAAGLPQLSGTHDVAIFDLDNDGDLDLVVGRCSGTRVFLNQRDVMGTTYCDPAEANSTGFPASIYATGSPVAGQQSLTLTGSSLPQDQFGYFLASQARGLIAMPPGSMGNLCLGGNIGRFNGAGQILFSGPAGEIALTVDTTMVPTPSVPVAIAAGDTWNFVAWYRDFVSGSSTSNFTNGIEIEFR